MDIEKFNEKNRESLEEMENIISMSKVKYIGISTELDVYLGKKKLPIDGEIHINPYMPSSRMYIFLDSGKVYPIDFTIPCICGIYPDEKHP
jgi:hypothetical protein